MPRSTASALGLSSFMGVLAFWGVGCNALVGVERATESANDCEAELELEDELIGGCIYRLGCDPRLASFTMSECVTLTAQVGNAIDHCTLGASNCGDVERCVGHRYEPDTTCEGQSGWICTGTIATYCGGAGPQFSTDCNVYGVGCTALPQADANVWPCGPPEIHCGPNETSNAVCEGDLQVACLNGATFGLDCGAVNMRCVEDGTSASCTAIGDSCSLPLTATCQDNEVHLCDQGGATVRYPCHTGTSCRVGTQGDVNCRASCAPPSCTEGCESDKTLRFCVGGVPVLRDCTNFGFDGCSESTLGDPSRPIAFCAMSRGNPYPGSTAR